MQTHMRLMETRRILLLVDDQPRIEAPLWDWLQRHGIALLYARSTTHARELFSRAHVDFVVSDLAREEEGIVNMMAGVTLAKDLRSQGSRVPICIYTNHKDKALHGLATSAGANHVTESMSGLIHWLEQFGA